MANTAGVCSSFKQELLGGIHNLNSGGHTLKFALYSTTASISAATTAYSTTGEVTSTGYTAGGLAATNVNVSLSGTTAIWTPSANLAWTGVTFQTDCALLYNSSAGNKAMVAFTFGTQTLSASNFTLTMPTNDASNALIRLN